MANSNNQLLKEIRFDWNKAEILKILNMPLIDLMWESQTIHRKFNKYDIAAAALFLASKVEESPRKVEQVLKVKEDWTRKGSQKPEPPLDPASDEYHWKLKL